MITLFHVLTFVGALGGLLQGISIGSHYFGFLGAVLLAPVFAFIGYHIGNVPWLLVLRAERKRFDKESTEALIDGLNGKYALCPNLVLVHLRNRGVDIQQFLPYLCELMTSDDFHTRAKGWIALRSALPEYAEMIPSYFPTLSKEKCLEIVEKIKNA